MIGERSASLLRLGSGGGDGDEIPSAGFEARVRARIAADGRVQVTPPWSDALASIARPAATMAAIVMAASLALELWHRSRGDDLALLTEQDAALSAALDSGLDDVFLGSEP